jgi:hypothetical protein
MMTVPIDVVSYQKKSEFDETCIPRRLLKAQQTKAGVWGKIVAEKLSCHITCPK